MYEENNKFKTAKAGLLLVALLNGAFVFFIRIFLFLQIIHGYYSYQTFNINEKILETQLDPIYSQRQNV